jgi:hypothetical protein
MRLPRLFRRRGDVAAARVVAGCSTCGTAVVWGPRAARETVDFLAAHPKPCRTWIDVSANEFRLPEI